MTQINAYLNFNGQCRKAMTFYQECLGGELVLQKVAESPMAAQSSSEMGGKILHGKLTRDNIVLMGSDMIGDNLVEGNNITLYLNCSNEREIKTVFNKLSNEGSVELPLHQSVSGSTFGKVMDKYGILWMLNYSKNNAQ
jgi:PhnB protein